MNEDERLGSGSGSELDVDSSEEGLSNAQDALQGVTVVEQAEQMAQEELYVGRPRNGRPSLVMQAAKASEDSRIFLDPIACRSWTAQDVLDYAGQLAVERPVNGREKEELLAQLRKVKNRVAAKQSRDRKKHERQTSEAIMDGLREENRRLRTEVEELNEELVLWKNKRRGDATRPNSTKRVKVPTEPRKEVP